MTTKRTTLKEVKEEVDRLKEAFGKFVSNDFKHLNDDFQGFRGRIDKLITLIITALISTALMLLGLVANLVVMIAKG